MARGVTVALPYWCEGRTMVDGAPGFRSLGPPSDY